MNKDGGPAFPRPISVEPNGDFAWHQEGMTLRDWFAGLALGAVLDSANAFNRTHPRPLVTAAESAMAAYRIADAMLAAREASA